MNYRPSYPGKMARRKEGMFSDCRIDTYTQTELLKLIVSFCL